MPKCPECQTTLSLIEEATVGKIVLCSCCQIPLEVVCDRPMEVMLLPELVEGDWAD